MLDKAVLILRQVANQMPTLELPRYAVCLAKAYLQVFAHLTPEAGCLLPQESDKATLQIGKVRYFAFP